MAVKIKINGRELSVEPGRTVLQAALDAGIYIPHFCYHPKLKVRGSCRMCLVHIEKTPKLQISCATTVAEGMVVETDNDEVRKARQAVIEFMLKNHPVDCPVCDKAGECTLQNYYMEYDQAASRLSKHDKKVKKGKRLAMGKTLVLDQERCVVCHRCIRFMREVAKNDCLTDARRGDRTVITTFPGEPVDNPYSLNLADICPVGAWTSKDFRFKKRVWFLTASPSVCPFCARGCNIFIDHEKGAVWRIRPRENDQVNQCWICDEGRLAYKAINDKRLTKAFEREGGGRKEVSMGAAVSAAARLLSESRGKILGIISASATLEEAELFKKLVKALDGVVGYERRKEGQDDAFLKRADRDANLKGISGLGIDRLAGEGIVNAELLLVLESLYSEPVNGASGKKSVVLSPKLSELAETASVGIPVAGYPEHSGTFVNFEGKAQKFEAALELKGDARPGAWVLRELAKKLGLEI
jgi:NADH-quinone oxidoreductase subunit G